VGAKPPRAEKHLSITTNKEFSKGTSFYAMKELTRLHRGWQGKKQGGTEPGRQARD